MKYRVFRTFDEADALSQDEATDRGCAGVTTHWWRGLRHEDGRGAVVLRDEEEAGGETVSEDAMRAGKWIPGVEGSDRGE